jgi:hypothetical protein
MGSALCGDRGTKIHNWYRWGPTSRDIEPEFPWNYERECQMMGCDAKEYAYALPDLQEVEALVLFLDQQKVPKNESLLERVRALGREQLKGLPYITDPREDPFIEGWRQAIGRVVELRAPAAEDPTGRNQDPIRRELHASTNREQALLTFQRWVKETRR